MKKFISAIIFAAVLSSCSDDIPLTPGVSLFNETPEILEETAIFRLATLNMPENAEYIIPVKFSGTAERDVDYEVSADAFVFGGENPVDSIVVSTLVFGTGKTISMTVELPEGMESGKHLTSEYTIQEIPAYVTLSSSYGILADSTSVRFSLSDARGKGKALKRDTEITLQVDKSRSTAVEGVDFEFADSSHFTIRAGKTEGELKLKMLKPEVTAGHDRIVLSIVYESRFGAGESVEMEMDMMDIGWHRLNGKWMMNSLITDRQQMEAFWGGSCSGYDLFPEQNDRDAVSFEIDNGTFKPAFSSDFKLYFTGDSNLRKGAPLTLDLGDGQSVDLHTFLIDNTNRHFSKDNPSEDNESVIAMRIIEGLENEPDILDFYVIDYISKSFMPELETMGKYAPEKPVAASPGQHINIRFKK